MLIFFYLKDYVIFAFIFYAHSQNLFHSARKSIKIKIDAKIT